MRVRTWILIAAVWILSLISVATFTHAQVPLPPSVPAPAPAPPNLITGSDLGFMVQGQDRGGRLMGEWMVRVDGKWRAVTGTGRPGVVPLAP